MLSTRFYQFYTIQSCTQQLQTNFTTMSESNTNKSAKNLFLTPGKSLAQPPTDTLVIQSSVPFAEANNTSTPIPSSPVDDSAIVPAKPPSVASDDDEDTIGNFLVMPEGERLKTFGESPSVVAFRDGTGTDYSFKEKLSFYKEALISAVHNQLVCDNRLRHVHIRVFQSVEEFNYHRQEILKYLAETYWERLQPPCDVEQYYHERDKENNSPFFIITHGYYKHCMKLAISKLSAIKHSVYDTEEEAAAIKLKYKNAKIAATRRRVIDEAMLGLEISVSNTSIKRGTKRKHQDTNSEATRDDKNEEGLG